MARRRKPNIPAELHRNNREIVGFLTEILEYRDYLIPTGEGIRHFANSVPTGFLSCDGAAVSRTTYAALFAEVGTTYGSGDGSTTFNLPNVAGFVIKT